MSDQSKTISQNYAHTPGPWRVMPPHIARALSLRIFAGNKFLASVGNSDDTLAETQTNADLISAAPELLEACRRVMLHGANEHAASDMVEAAIAKAEGRE